MQRPWIHSRPFFRGRAPFTAADLPVAVAVFSLLVAILHLGHAMTTPTALEQVVIRLDIAQVPYYAFRSVARAFIAFSWALVFTLVYGSLAAHSVRAERVLMPLLDILQSVPVLGFLSVTLTGFLALFPGSLLGMEMASIFAIFTSQVWNMAYSFFQSVRAVPRDLREAAIVMRLTPFQRFARIEVPFAMNGLVWNAMVSFGNGWFFLAASEAITVLGSDIRLPGIGSYLATAVEAGEFGHIGVAILAMISVILLLDVMFFRPLLAWAQKFGPGSALDEDVESIVLKILGRSRMVEAFRERVLRAASDLFVDRLPLVAQRALEQTAPGFVRRWKSVVGWALLVGAGLLVLSYASSGAAEIATRVTLEQVLGYVVDGLFTLLRVFSCVVFASVVWVPIGLVVGSRPGLARRLRPIIQLGCSFPANLLYPMLTWVFLRYGVDLGIGSVLLMLLGSQWYILFNVIIGALSVPNDLREVGRVMRFTRWQRFRHVMLPVVLPYWVTGAITAAGGAWNASIVAEVTTLGADTLTCRGLGASMTKATQVGDWPGIILTIVIMSAFVVATNRLVWRRLYLYAEEHLRLET